MDLSANWKDATGVFTPLELQVIALAAGAPGECASCGARDRPVRRLARWTAKAFALHAPAPLANQRLEALRQLACRSFARGGTMGAGCAETARAAGLSDIQIETLRDMGVGWREAR